MDEETKEYECEECGSQWTITHDNFDEVTFCPFCGLDLDEPYEEEDGWDDQEDDDYE
jgi:hypothetical protein